MAERIIAIIEIVKEWKESSADRHNNFDISSKELSLGHPNPHSSLISSLLSIITSFGIGFPISKSSNLTVFIFLTSLLIIRLLYV